MIRPKVKLFREDNDCFGGLEGRVNDWIEKENVSIVDFKISQTQYHTTFAATYIPITKSELLTEKYKNDKNQS